MLIETAKLNGVDPQAWLTDTLDRISDHKTRASTSSCLGVTLNMVERNWNTAIPSSWPTPDTHREWAHYFAGATGAAPAKLQIGIRPVSYLANRTSSTTIVPMPIQARASPLPSQTAADSPSEHSGFAQTLIS